MRTYNLAAVNNPLGFGDPIKGPSGPVHREEALSKVTGTAKIATNAVIAELEWRLKPAFIGWKRLLGQRFPNPE